MRKSSQAFRSRRLRKKVFSRTLLRPTRSASFRINSRLVSCAAKMRGRSRRRHFLHSSNLHRVDRSKESSDYFRRKRVIIRQKGLPIHFERVTSQAIVLHPSLTALIEARTPRESGKTKKKNMITKPSRFFLHGGSQEIGSKKTYLMRETHRVVYRYMIS